MQKPSKYLFTSERLGFRNWSKNDLDQFAALNADDEVMRYFPTTLSRKETEDFIDRLLFHYDKYGHNYFAVETVAEEEFIGFIGLAYQVYKSDFTPATDVGWRLKRSAWGKGYATEGARRCLQFAAEELKLAKVFSTCTAKNVNSEKVMQKIGMQKVKEFNHPRLKEFPEYERCVLYELEFNK